MKNKTFIKITVLLFTVITYFSWIAREESGYDPFFKTISCKDEYGCFHEIGHQIDDKMGWVSKSDEFRVALANYAIMNWHLPVEQRNEIAGKILFYPGIVGPRYKDHGFHIAFGIHLGRWGGPTELYADMFAWVEGDKDKMPEFFVDFYDWELAEKLVEKHVKGD